MLQYFFAAFVICHGIIHILGFANTLKEDNSTGFVKAVPGHQAWLWLLAGLLMVLTGLLLLLHEHWHILALIAAFFSQILIFLHWKEAKWGSILNIVILAALLFLHQ